MSFDMAKQAPDRDRAEQCRGGVHLLVPGPPGGDSIDQVVLQGDRVTRHRLQVSIANGLLQALRR